MGGFTRSLIPYEEFDYQVLLSALKGYAHPRDKITTLLRKGSIIRIKKGLYIFGEGTRKGLYSQEILANLIYGPSYISLEFALQYYGMIPERVESVTSATPGRSRKFSTPIGQFTYRKIPMAAFRTGVDQVATADGRPFLIAVPEKALADKLRSDRLPVQTRQGLQNWLFDDLRMEPTVIREMNYSRLEDYASRYRSRKILLLSRLVRYLSRQRVVNAHA